MEGIQLSHLRLLILVLDQGLHTILLPLKVNLHLRLAMDVLMETRIHLVTGHHFMESQDSNNHHIKQIMGLSSANHNPYVSTRSSLYSLQPLQPDNMPSPHYSSLLTRVEIIDRNSRTSVTCQNTQGDNHPCIESSPYTISNTLRLTFSIYVP